MSIDIDIDMRRAGHRPKHHCGGPGDGLHGGGGPKPKDAAISCSPPGGLFLQKQIKRVNEKRIVSIVKHGEITNIYFLFVFISASLSSKN